MKIPKTLAFGLLISCLSSSLFSQQISSNYFTDNNPLRQDFNPAFKPKTDYFISLPVLGYSAVNIGNNSLSMKDVIYNIDGQTVFFNNPKGSTDKLYRLFQPTTLIQADARVNIAAFGMRIQKDYLTLSVTERVDAALGLPKDLFKLALYGTPDVYYNKYNLKNLESNLSVYTEFGLCYSKRLSREFTIGGKLKLLMGNANVSNTNSTLTLEAGIDQWNLKGQGTANYSGGLPLTIGTRFQSIAVKGNASVLNFLNKPSGMGAGIDLGINYRMNDEIVLSAALLDFGFINWFNNVKNISYTADFTYGGISQIDGNSILSPSGIFSGTTVTDSLLNVLKSSYSTTQSSKNYTTSTTAKINLGCEYKFPGNKLSLGLLSHSEFVNSFFTEEITASVNVKPEKWLNGSLTYSVLNGRFSTFGLGVGVRAGIVHFLLGADYIPFQLVSLGAGSINVPYASNAYNLHMGINIVFNKSSLKHMHNRTGLYGYDADED